MFDPDFRLIEGGQTLALADIHARGGVIDVAKTGAAGVIGALKAGEGWIVRDASVATGSGPGIHLQTSGTTGAPKWVSHSLERLMARIKPGDDKARWLLTFNPGSFAGLQVILSAMTGGHALIAPDYGATVADMADLAAAHRATHISG
ncbi:MAG: AMP-binding protein, partial [Asticcacaulis sp.]